MFGQVVEGMDVVRAMEACGSRSGDTAFDIMIADCGELPATGGAATICAAWQTACLCTLILLILTSRYPCLG